MVTILICALFPLVQPMSSSSSEDESPSRSSSPGNVPLAPVPQLEHQVIVKGRSAVATCIIPGVSAAGVPVQLALYLLSYFVRRLKLERAGSRCTCTWLGVWSPGVCRCGPRVCAGVVPGTCAWLGVWSPGVCRPCACLLAAVLAPPPKHGKADIFTTCPTECSSNLNNQLLVLVMCMCSQSYPRTA